jgi:hypothetical protein
VVKQGTETLETVELGVGVPHTFVICADIDGKDAWVGTSKGLGWAMGDDYYPGLQERSVHVTSVSKK